MKIILIVLYALCLKAGETDQYSAGSTQLKDAYLNFNNFYFKTINDTISNSGEISCNKLTDKILSNIIKKVGLLATKSSEIERYPDDSVSSREYYKHSIYSRAGIPLVFTQLRRTINIGGVYIGTDKIGHLGLIGRNYYHHYLKYLKYGYTQKNAIRETVIHGIKQEMNILGFQYNGVFSFADLEANYQGLMFAISLCQGDNSYLTKEKSYWVVNQRREFDIRTFITPKMDESYNPSFRSAKLWNKIKPKLTAIYCDLKNTSIYQERIRNYKQKDLSTYSDQVIQAYFLKNSEINRSSESMDRLCP